MAITHYRETHNYNMSFIAFSSKIVAASASLPDLNFTYGFLVPKKYLDHS